MLDRAYTIKIIPRDDGGLRVLSDDAPGLILSGADPAQVMAHVLPALEALANHAREHNMLRSIIALLISPYSDLTTEALEAGVLMEHGQPKPERGRAILAARQALASTSR